MFFFDTLRNYFSVARASLADEKAQGKKPKLTRNEREFQAAAIEIMETPASPGGRMLGFALISLTLIAIIWSLIGRIDIYATLQGKIIPSGHIKVIEPLITGKVQAIHIRQGQEVAKGAVLIELDPTEHEAERTRLEEDVTITTAISVRVRAAMIAIREKIAAGEITLDMPERVPERVRLLQREVLTYTLSAYEAEQKKLVQEAYQRTMELERTQNTVLEREKLVEVMTERLVMLDTLAKKGSGSRAAYLERAELLYEQRADLAADKGRLAEIEAGISTLRQQAIERRETILHDLVKELAENEKRLAGLHQEVRKARVREDQSTLYAPVGGTIQQLTVHTVGDVVTTGQQLMVVVPMGTKLEVEAMLLNKDKGFVRDGQKARVKIETFNFTKYGIIPGEVLSVSNDAVDPRQQAQQTQQAAGGGVSQSSINSGQLLFPVRIGLERETIFVDGEEVRLSPGMSVSAEVKTGDRRIIEFVLSPLLRMKDESLGER